MSTVRELIGGELENEYLDFNLEEVKEVLATLAIETAVDLPQAENMQRLALRGADVLSDYLGQIVKTIGILDAKLTKTKNSVLVTYEAPKGKTTADMRKAASEADPDAEKITIQLAQAKAAKMALDKKYDILVKSHHYYKDIASGFKRVVGTEGSGSGWS